MVFDTRALFPGPPTSTPTVAWAHVDEQGRLVLPAEVATRLGLIAGAQVRLEPMTQRLRLHRPVTHLAKLYIEPTNACNLDCATCFRHGWDEPIGRMSEAAFDAILAGLAALDELPTVYFGGIGEPLSHRRTINVGRQGARAGGAHRADHQRDAAQRAAGARADGRWVWICCGSPLMARLPKVTPTCGWALNWRRSSPTWRASASCARAATTPGPSWGSRSWR